MEDNDGKLISKTTNGIHVSINSLKSLGYERIWIPSSLNPLQMRQKLRNIQTQERVTCSS